MLKFITQLLVLLVLVGYLFWNDLLPEPLENFMVKITLTAVALLALIGFLLSMPTWMLGLILVASIGIATSYYSTDGNELNEFDGSSNNLLEIKVDCSEMDPCGTALDDTR